MSVQHHKTLLSVMERLDTLLKRERIEYFLIAGSLMGSLRYKNRMPWDDDIDIGVFTKTFEQLPFNSYGLSVRKVSFGYKVFDTNDNVQIKLEDTFPFVDVFMFVSHENKHIYELEETRTKWPQEYFFHDELYPLTTCEYSNLSLPCPAKSSTFLSRAFPGWESVAKISGSHTGHLLYRQYEMPIVEKTTNDVHKYLDTLHD